ncbi:MAG: ATP synthase subunit C [Ilumatobacteraceae bacterium]|jgi:V/A-type H+-transporting ATPase subunit K
MNPWLLTVLLATPLAIGIPLTRSRTPRAMLRIVVLSLAASFALAIAVLMTGGGDDTSAAAVPAAAVTEAPAVVVQQTSSTTTNDSGSAFIGAAIAVAASALGAGIAIAYAGSAALATVSEQPDLFGRAMVVVGLAEGVAIYGLIVAVLILGKV